MHWLKHLFTPSNELTPWQRIHSVRVVMAISGTVIAIAAAVFAALALSHAPDLSPWQEVLIRARVTLGKALAGLGIGAGGLGLAYVSFQTLDNSKFGDKWNGGESTVLAALIVFWGLIALGIVL